MKNNKKGNIKNNKNILVASESLALYTTKRLLEEAKKLKIEANWFNPYDSLLSLKEHHSTTQFPGLYFHRTSGTRYDDYDLIVSRHFEDTGLQITNPLNALSEFRSKDLQALFFQRNLLPAVPSILYRGALNENYWEEITRLSRSENYILKMVRGNQGTGVNLLNGAQSLKSLLETFHALKDQKFLIQPYVEHKKEWRVFVVKGDILGVIERTISPSDFRGNSKRSKGKFLKKLPTQLHEKIHKAVELSKLDYCGIDLMDAKQGPVFLEINAVPGFEQMEELSGLNIAKELISKIYL